MATESFQLDPNAVAYSDDEIVGKVNSASANISRAGSVLAAARPVTGIEVRDAILALSDVDRKLVKTNPTTGEFKVIAVKKNVDGKLYVTCDDVAES